MYITVYRTSCTNVHNRKICDQKHDLPQSYCGDNREGTFFHDYIYKRKYITVNSFGAHWVKNIKDNAIYLNKQQIKDAVAYLLYNVVSLLALKSSTRL